MAMITRPMPALEQGRPPGRPLRFFRPEIEAAIKAAGVIALLALIVLPTAWGYEQRRQAREWQNVACSYRIKEVARRTPFIATAQFDRDACATLQRLGFDPSDVR
jgi:hypothetical protein